MHVLCIPITLWRQPSGTQEVWPRNARVYALGVRDARPLSGGCRVITKNVSILVTPTIPLLLTVVGGTQYFFTPTRYVA